MPPKTSTERSREYRARIQSDNDKHEQSKEKERIRWRKRSTADKQKSKTDQQIEERRQKTKEKVRRHRAKKKQNLSGAKLLISSTAFKCRRSFGKAVKRVVRALPKESPKKVEVVANILSQLTPRKRKAIFECDSALKRRKLIDEPRKKRSDAI